MATTRIMPLHTGKGRTESRAISDILDYVANPQKTDHGRLITGYECDSRTADAEFLLAKRQYIAATGRVRGADDVIAYHVRQSFKPGEITPEEANRLGVEFAKRFTKGNHAFVVCTHIDKSHVHNHIIWSAVNADCDRKFRNFWGSTKAVRRLSDTICIENGLSIVENPKLHGKSYNKWLGDQAKPSHREQLRVMIDRALEQKPADFDALLKLLTEMGCEVSRRGKAIRLKAPGWKNVARMDDKLGAGYSEAEIRAVLAGEKQHTPRKKSLVQPEPPKVNLLVDIQAKLQAGKGAGYARWAKVFNLKQMAQTMNYLSENNLLEYSVYLDTDTPYLTVRRAWHTENNRPVILDELKTKAAARNIPLPVCLADCLREAKANSTSEYVVPNRDGDPLSYTQLKRLWQYIVTRTTKERVYYRYENGKRVQHTVTPVFGEKAAHNGNVIYSLDFEVTPHQLRHAGVDPKTVQYLAGHENSKTTMDIYAKVKYNKPEELFGVVNCAFHQVPGE